MASEGLKARIDIGAYESRILLCVGFGFFVAGIGKKGKSCVVA